MSYMWPCFLIPFESILSHTLYLESLISDHVNEFHWNQFLVTDTVLRISYKCPRV